MSSRDFFVICLIAVLTLAAFFVLNDILIRMDL